MYPLLAEAGLLLNHPKLIIVDDEHLRPLNTLYQLGWREPGDLLTGIVDVRYAQLLTLAGIPDHSNWIVWRDDSDLNRLGVVIFKGETAGFSHGPCVKAGDLVIILVRADEEGSGELIGELQYPRGIHTLIAQPGDVFWRILAHRGHQQRALAKQGQVVGNVAAAPTSLAPH